MKRAAVLMIVFGVLAAFGFFGWALYATRDFGTLTGGSGPLTALIIGGVVVTAALAAVLMGLAFYSSRKGYDEQPDYDRHGR